MSKGSDYVLYWMQQSQRSEGNHALEFCSLQAWDQNLPLIVLFCLMDDYPDANLRHYQFMVQGLEETRESLARREILMVIMRGSPVDVIPEVALRASCMVCDRGYLTHQKMWYSEVVSRISCPVIQVESDVVIPVDHVSQKAEFAARTIRPKIHTLVPEFLGLPEEVPLRRSSLTMMGDFPGIERIGELLSHLDVDRSAHPVDRFFIGGTSRAKALLGKFIADGLSRYEENSNQPQTEDISRMSPYLHFGQISPVYIATQITGSGVEPSSAREAYLEELIVRRELAANFAHFTPDYDSFSSIPAWAKKTLMQHEADVREHLYTIEDLEQAQTHDEYWNAAMNEMKHTGFMHNYMRMYWGKKVLEWSRTPQEAYERLVMLNNKYFLDGRDPNSYAGVGWIFGLHDRAWQERPVFGKVRVMTASGLERKCDIRAYVAKVEEYVQAARLDNG
ncbi:MAG: deoxyribodipyrimidine photo-lyase [Desulfomonilia bacterium]